MTGSRARGGRESCPPAESPVGALCRALPSFARLPPVEAVVFAWGASEDHQLGLDSIADSKSPKVVEALLGLQLMGRGFPGTPLIAGSRNTLAIDAEGQLWSWGWNDRGTLGHGHRQRERKPRRVQGLKGVRIVQAAIGGWHCLALSDMGQVYAWGGNEYSQCGVLDPCRDILTPQPCLPQLRVRQVACGGMNSVALTEEGEVWTWGEPWGDFSLEVSREPRRVEGASDIAAIACGAFHSMALTRAGDVLAWGTNDYGQLGNGSTCYSTVPERVVDLDGIPIADIAAGGWHSLALTSDGQIYVWGRGEYGRLGVGDRTGSSKLRPHPVRGLEAHVIVQVAAGGTHSMALTEEGRMFIWGRASYGRLGLGEGARDHYSPVELALPGGHERWRVAAVTCGGRHSMCLAVPLRDVQSATDEVAMDAVAAASFSDGFGGGGVGGGGGGGFAALPPPPAVQLGLPPLQPQAAAQPPSPPPSASGGGPALQQAPMARAGSTGIPPPVSPPRRPASAAGIEAATAALSLSRAGSYGLSAGSLVPPRAVQVRVASPSRSPRIGGSAGGGGGGGGAAAAAGGSSAAAAIAGGAPSAGVVASGSPSFATLSPSNRSSRVLGLSGALSDCPPVDATPISGEEDEDDEAEARAQAELDRRHGTGATSSAGGAPSGPPSIASAIGAPRGEEEGEGDAGYAEGEGEGDGGAVPGFLRTDSVTSVTDTVDSPVASGPGATYASERSSMHTLTHLS